MDDKNFEKWILRRRDLLDRLCNPKETVFVKDSTMGYQNSGTLERTDAESYRYTLVPDDPQDIKIAFFPWETGRIAPLIRHREIGPMRVSIRLSPPMGGVTSWPGNNEQTMEYINNNCVNRLVRLYTSVYTGSQPLLSTNIDLVGLLQASGHKDVWYVKMPNRTISARIHAHFVLRWSGEVFNIGRRNEEPGA